MQKNSVIIGALVMAFIVALMLVPPSTQRRLLYGMRQTPERELQREIAKNVQTGATPQQVLHFLDAEHLEHGSLERLTQDDSDKRYYSVGTPMIRAIKRHTASAVFGFQSLRIIFVFTDQHELDRFDIRPVYTAP
jgi:hypothetical protein